MNTLPNTMTLGSGPYDGLYDNNYTIKEVAREFPISKEEAERKHGHIEGRVCDYFVSFDYSYNEAEEWFTVSNLHCKEGQFDVMSHELEYLAEQLEDKLHTAKYKIERVNLFETLAERFKPTK